MKPTKSILFSCAGLGMGNASRISALLEELESLPTDKERLSLHVISWGPGHRFLQEFRRQGGHSFELIEIASYSGSKFAFLRFPLRYIANVWKIRRHMRRIRPHLTVLDSDYHFPSYFGCKSPIVYIGQAFDVVRRVQKGNYRPRSAGEFFNLIFREKLDAAIQNLFSDRILVPCFNGTGAEDGKKIRIPLVVRREFLAPPSEPSLHEPGILLGGSSQEKEVFVRLAREHHMRLLTPERKAQLTLSSASVIDRFDPVFTQGGLSSISECIARARFMIVFPLRDHPEQQMNALEVEKLGYGMKADREDLADYPRLMKRAYEMKGRASRTEVRCDGAQIAVREILRLLDPS